MWPTPPRHRERHQTSTNAVVNTVRSVSGPKGVAITPNGSYAYVANAVSNTVSVINTSTNTVVKTVRVGATRTGSPSPPMGATPT